MVSPTRIVFTTFYNAVDSHTHIACLYFLPTFRIMHSTFSLILSPGSPMDISNKTWQKIHSCHILVVAMPSTPVIQARNLRDIMHSSSMVPSPCLAQIFLSLSSFLEYCLGLYSYQLSSRLPNSFLTYLPNSFGFIVKCFVQKTIAINIRYIHASTTLLYQILICYNICNWFLKENNNRSRWSSMGYHP